MKNIIRSLTIIYCFSLSTSLAQAEPEAHDMQDTQHEQRVDQHFKEMDGNGDNTISKAEFDAFHSKHFQDVDANSDGKITREEMREGHRENREKNKANRFNEADANHDGALNREEASKMPMLSRRFDNIDANKDGKVTRAEMDAEMGKRRPKRD